jgi:pyruvate/oxaloacetate carboxyltransferase
MSTEFWTLPKVDRENIIARLRKLRMQKIYHLEQLARAKNMVDYHTYHCNEIIKEVERIATEYKGLDAP